MCMMVALIQNKIYNYSKLIFEQMVSNLTGAMFLQYPRFVQMMLDHLHPELAKSADDLLVQSHMTANDLHNYSN